MTNQFQSFDEKTREKFKQQEGENLRLQSQIDHERKDNAKLTKFYLELADKLARIYSHVGLEETYLDLNKI